LNSDALTKSCPPQSGQSRSASSDVSVNTYPHRWQRNDPVPAIVPEVCDSILRYPFLALPGGRELSTGWNPAGIIDEAVK